MSSNDVDVTARYEIYIGPHMYREVTGMVLIKLMNSRQVLPTTPVIKLGSG